MSDVLSNPSTAFVGTRRLRAGPLAEVALAVKAATESGVTEPVLVFDDATGRVVDLDLRGSDADVVARLSRRSDGAEAPGNGEAQRAPARAAPYAPGRGGAPSPRRGRGRPKLGVVGREVTLLPRHWAWLADQPAGASATLRRLVDQARRAEAPAQRRRKAREAAYRVMHAIAGDAPGYEEATRALFAGDRPGLEARIASWPGDVRGYVLQLAFPPDAPSSAEPSSTDPASAEPPTPAATPAATPTGDDKETR